MTCSAALSCSISTPTTAPGGRVASGVVGPVVTVMTPAHSFRSALPSIAERNAALARWSSIGVPSPDSTTAAASTVSSVHGRPVSTASVARARIGVAATPPRPIRTAPTTPFSTSRAKATATLEMSSYLRLAILWKATIAGCPPGTRTARISSPRDAERSAR